jgi:hypothetical protein
LFDLVKRNIFNKNKVSQYNQKEQFNNALDFAKEVIKKYC